VGPRDGLDGRKISSPPDFFLFEPIVLHYITYELHRNTTLFMAVAYRLSNTITYRLQPCATPSVSVTVTPQSHFESGHSTRIMSTITDLAQGMSNTYNTYTLGTQPLHFTRVVVARNQSILFEARTLSPFSIISRWEQSLCVHSSLGLLVFVIVYYNEIVPNTRLPSRRPVKLQSGPL